MPILKHDGSVTEMRFFPKFEYFTTFGGVVRNVCRDLRSPCQSQIAKAMSLTWLDLYEIT